MGNSVSIVEQNKELMKQKSINEAAELSGIKLSEADVNYGGIPFETDKATMVVDETEQELEADELVDKLCDVKRWHHWESESGVRQLEDLVSIIGYRNIDEFLSDNSGAQQGVVEFINEWTAKNDEWEEAIRSEIDSTVADENE